jgi:hypothetical protein
MLKKARYWRAFTAATRSQAEKAAAEWWGEQQGFDKVSGWTLPAEPPTPGTAPQWTVTIVYKPSDAEPGRPTLH